MQEKGVDIGSAVIGSSFSATSKIKKIKKMPTSVTNYSWTLVLPRCEVRCHFYNTYFTTVSQIIRTLDMKVSDGFGH